MNPFDYAHDLVTKEGYDEETPDRKDYKQFLINRTLSYHNDLIHFVNTMNRYPDVTDRLHYDFFTFAVPKKRRSKKYWAKGKKYANMEIVKEYYKYSTDKAIKALSILSEGDIKTLKSKMYKGGMS
tara:strand:- start:1038 stop:1415 length:378 start_codon:yes stop_codon:yes gene_type:complete